MEVTRIINIGLLAILVANLGATLEFPTVSNPLDRQKRQVLGFPQFRQEFKLVNTTVPTVPSTRYIVQYQQLGLFPLSFPFNWPLSLIPVVSNQIFNVTQVQVSPPTVATTEVVSNALEDTGVREDVGTCGKAAFYSQATTRIVDGDPAQYGEFPWLVAIMRDGGRTHLCGGSLVSDRYILSAAHCYASYTVSDVSQLRVYIGDYNIYDPNDVRNQVRSVSRLIRHRKWNSPTNFNDLALLKLDAPVSFNKYVQPVCLARGSEASFYSSNTVATVAGWGKVQWGYPEIQRTPLKIQVPLVDMSTCQRSIYPHTIGNSMICAGAGYKSACLGDSGGPLTVYSDGRWYQIGIVSWGLNCNGYGVFTRVSSFASWIDKYMKT